MMTSALVITVSGYGIGGLLRRNLFQQNNQNQPIMKNMTLNDSVQSIRGGGGTATSSPGEDDDDGDYMVSHSSRGSDEKVVISISQSFSAAGTEEEERGYHQLLEDNSDTAEEVVDEGGREYEVQDDGGSKLLIPLSDIELAFEESFAIIQKNNDAIVKAGWKLVHENELYTLFKRRGKDENGREEKGPVEYMMKGIVDDVSPRNFLHAQTNKGLRQGWDKTMSDMETNEHDPHSLDNYVREGDDYSEDTLYYRTKWPWPLKDRDYTLARRVQFKHDQGKEAVIFVSKATEELDVPLKDGVIRVENYWCRSAYFATQSIPAFSSSVGSDMKETMVKSKNGGVGTKNHPPVQLSGVSTSEVLNSTFEHESGSHANVNDVRHRLKDMFSGSSLGLGKNVFEKVKVPRLKKMLAGVHGEHSGRGSKKSSSGKRGSSAYDLKGTQFVTIFCDDSKVPLPSRVVDMISTQAEKVVPESMKSLHKAAVSLQEKEI